MQGRPGPVAGHSSAPCAGNRCPGAGATLSAPSRPHPGSSHLSSPCPGELRPAAGFSAGLSTPGLSLRLSGEQGGLQAFQPPGTSSVALPTTASPPGGVKPPWCVWKRLHVSHRDRYAGKQGIDARAEPLYWLVHLLADVAPFLLFVLRMDFYCLILSVKC